MDEIFKALRENPDLGIRLLAELHQVEIFSYIREFITDYELAKDVYQNTVIAIWVNYEAIEGKANPLYWIFGIAKKQALKAIRDERVGFKELIEDQVNLCCCDEADKFLYYNELVDWIKTTSALTAREKEFLLAIDVDGLSNKEVCEKFDVKPQTARNILQSARIKIREKFRSSC